MHRAVSMRQDGFLVFVIPSICAHKNFCWFHSWLW